MNIRKKLLPSKIFFKQFYCIFVLKVVYFFMFKQGNKYCFLHIENKLFILLIIFVFTSYNDLIFHKATPPLSSILCVIQFVLFCLNSITKGTDVLHVNGNIIGAHYYAELVFVSVPLIIPLKLRNKTDGSVATAP